VDPPRITAPEVTKQNVEIFKQAVGEGKPASVAAAPTGVNEPPRSDQPSEAPVQMSAPEGGTGVGVSIVSAPSGAAADPNAVIKPVGPTNTVLPAAQAPAAAPDQINDIKPGEVPTQNTAANATAKKKKAPKADLSDESSSKKKKKKGLGKLNPF
jgi:outer membrane protein assembly factor BamD